MGGPGAGGGGDEDLVARARAVVDVELQADEFDKRLDDVINGATEKIKALSQADLTLEGLAKGLRQGELFEAKLRDAVSVMNRLSAAANQLEASFVSRGEVPPISAQVQIDEFREAAEIVRAFIGETNKLDGIPAKLQPGEKAVRDFNKTVIQATRDNEKFDESARLGDLGVPQITSAERALQAYNATHARALEENKRFDEQAKNARLGAPQISKADQDLQKMNATWERALQENKRYDEQAKAAKLGVPQITAADRAIQALGKTQERALRENEEFDKGLRDGTGALIKGVNAAGQAGAKLTPFAQKVQNAVNSATGSLSRFGLTSRDVGLILGTGLLSGGLALVAREALQMVLALGKAVLDLARLGAEVIHLREQVSATFGPASDEIRSFANTTASAFGISERAALKFLNQTGLIFQSLKIGKVESAGFAQGLLEAAVVFQRVAGNGKSIDQVLQDLQSTLTGNIEALRQYGVAVSEADLRQKAQELGLGRIEGELRSNEKSLLALIFTYDQALARIDEFGKLSDSQLTTEQKLAAASEDLQVKIGELLAPALLKITEVGLDFVEFLQEGISDLRDWVGESPELAKALGLIVDAFVMLEKLQLGNIFNAIKIGLTPLKLELQAAAKAAGIVARGVDALRGITPEERKAMDAAAERRKEQEATLETEKKIREEREKARKQLIEDRKNYQATTDDLEKLKDAHEKLNRAREDGARRVQEAEDEYQDTIRQNARAIEDANRRVEDAYENRRRTVGDALKKIEEAENQNERSIFDSKRNLEDAQIQAARSVRDAEERLSDARIENAKKVKDAEKALFDARRKQFQALIDAQIAIQDALQDADSDAENEARRQFRRLKDDESVTDAKKKLDETQADSEKQLARLERDLAEERIDAKRKVEEAQIRLDRTVRDASKRMSDAEVAYQRAVEDASKKIEDALRERRRTYEDAAERIVEAEERITNAQRESAEAISDAQEEVDELNFRFNTTSLTLGDIIEKLTVAKQLLEDINLLEQPGNTINNPDGTISVHGHGGAFAAGRPRLVGDLGPEIEIPNYPGAIVSNQDIKKALLQLAEGQRAVQSRTGGRSVDITVIESAHPEASAEAVINRMILEGVV